MLDWLNEILSSGIVPKCFNEALNFPIKKKGDSKDAFQYRPIALLNSSYKLFTKVLANRMSLSLDSVIHKSQNGFVRGRQLEDSVNAMLASLSLQYDDIDQLWSELPIVTMLDIEMAYDSVDRLFLFKIFAKDALSRALCKTL